MKHVIIGNGIAGTTAASHIRTVDSSAEIIVISEEEVPCYSRIRLIDYLAKEAALQDIIIYKDEWYHENRIKLILNTHISEINAANKQVHTDKGETIDYDKLLLSTGGFSFVPPIKGSDLNGVFTLRSIKDADEIIAYASSKRKVILIGGGLLGLEAGNSLRKLGKEITVVEFFPRLLPRQMDTAGASILKGQMEEMGFRFYLGAQSEEIAGNGTAKRLVLKDRTEIQCDMIIISAGIRPRAELPKKLGLSISKGLAVNDRMETDLPDIYAAGDLIEHKERFYGIWPAARKQGEIAGINMAGGDALYHGTTVSNVLKVVGIDLAAAGNIDADEEYESIVYKDEKKHIFKKLVIRDDTLIGCILYGDISDYQKIFKAITGKANILDIRKALIQWDLSGL